MFDLVCCVALLAVVVLLGLKYNTPKVERFDTYIARHIQKIPDIAGLFLTVLSYLTRPLFLGFYASVIFIVIWILQSHTKNVHVVEMVLGMGSIEATKLVIRRPRRDDPNVQKHGINSFSYPSGHAGSSLLFAMVMSTLYPIPILVATLSVGAICVGISRIYIRVHYASDVIGGWLMAGAIFSLLLFLGLK